MLIENSLFLLLLVRGKCCERSHLTVNIQFWPLAKTWKLIKFSQTDKLLQFFGLADLINFTVYKVSSELDEINLITLELNKKIAHLLQLSIENLCLFLLLVWKNIINRDQVGFLLITKCNKPQLKFMAGIYTEFCIFCLKINGQNKS